MKVLKFICNDELVGLFNEKSDVVTFLKKQWFLDKLELSDEFDDFELLDDVVMSVEDGVDKLFDKGRLNCYNEDIVEREDDYMVMELYEEEVK